MTSVATLAFPYTDFARALAAWFTAAQRDLPWRHAAHAHDPYAVAVSEFMLQQTTVAAVIPYFHRFLERFPTAQALADAPLDEVLALWSGLGYYSRARNLHALGKAVAARGNFPRELGEILELPGVGRYTAGAIASIAYDEAAPIVDANVARVFARVFLIEGDLKQKSNTARLWQEAENGVRAAKTSGIAPSQFNPALMELGALVCTPKNPACESCPVERFCAARKLGRQNEIPFVAPRARPTELFDVCVRLRVGSMDAESAAESTVEFDRTAFWLRQRSHEAGIWWRGMWELPRTTRRAGESAEQALERLLRQELGLADFAISAPLKRLIHGVTTHRIALDCYEVVTETAPRDTRCFTLQESDALAIPSTMRRLLRELAQRDAEPRQSSLF